MSSDTPSRSGATRREFLQSAGALVGVPAGSAEAAASAATPSAIPADEGDPVGAAVAVTLRVDGKTHRLVIEPRVTLLDALRDHIGLTGTKKGCDRGQCGACTVLVGGERIDACLTLAVAHEGEDIVTVEGLGRPDRLHPVQAAFVAEDAFQCGYCTPGQVCSVVALLAEAERGDASAATPDVRGSGPVALDDDEIRERMSGNLCRCGAYGNIVAVVRGAASVRSGGTG